MITKFEHPRFETTMHFFISVQSNASQAILCFFSITQVLIFFFLETLTVIEVTFFWQKELHQIFFMISRIDKQGELLNMLPILEF